ncbi:kynureninase [Neolewinella lacunae]|uniref:Kynureninase n=1 Tax=Neolewinella lacunae TaxID=1517758 RepID=A0A923PP99_9BACT|nr:kynureninase [Neolewinella lacunae]MBC6994192.1 kynureninase [Neolewinella lacunae]MDN3634649.1 kynureninase [Neolewinella lacunae]
MVLRWLTWGKFSRFVNYCVIKRSAFHLPPDKIYLCGNSLGPQPKAAAAALQAELDSWRERGVEGWWLGDGPEGGWLGFHRRLEGALADLVGAQPAEVTVANALTVNLHLLLVSFFRPAGKRCKIIMEAGAFPSDQHAIISQLRFHGLDPAEHLIELRPLPGEDKLRTEDIVAAIQRVGDELALVLWSGVHYYTGQYFALEPIARAGHAVGAMVGFDLAHAAGNVPMRLHDWGSDFAVWCSYKYLNGGPGAPGGLFVHERHHEREDLPRFAGWWGHRESDRFLMRREFRPERGAAGWQVSTVPVLGMAPLLASLPLFAEAGGMLALRAHSRELTQRLYAGLEQLPGLRIITPDAAEDRGAQLSVYVPGHRPDLEATLSAAGLVVDYREDNLGGSAGGVLRLAPAPLYTLAEEVDEAVRILAEALQA